MKAKDFLNIKKPHFWIALVVILVLAFAGVVAILDKEVIEETVDTPTTDVIDVDIEDETSKMTDGEIILKRFKAMDWEEVKQSAKEFGEEGWTDGIAILSKNEKADITLYGYNDADYKYRGVAVDYKGNVSFFDWVYASDEHIKPKMYWNKADRQLQITMNLYDGTGVNAEELHVIVVHDTNTLEDFVFRSKDYLMEIEERLAGTGVTVGSYVDIKLGSTMMLEFKPVKTADGKENELKLHQAIIYLKQSKDGFIFEIGDIGVEPEKRKATIEIEGVEEKYTEVQYISSNGYILWFPEKMSPVTIHGHEGFTNKVTGDEVASEVIIVPTEEIKLDETYLKEAAGNYKSSGEYKKVTVSKVKTVTSDDKNVKIQKIEVVHDETAHRFYLVKGENQVLLLTVSLEAKELDSWGVRIEKMIQTITFPEKVEEKAE